MYGKLLEYSIINDESMDSVINRVLVLNGLIDPWKSQVIIRSKLCFGEYDKL